MIGICLGFSVWDLGFIQNDLQMYIIEKIRNIKKSLSHHQPLIEIFIYKDHLLHNLHAFQKAYLGLQFSPVLKANAYGHGLKEVLTLLKDQELPFVSIDSYYEAIIVKKLARNLRALVIGYSRIGSIAKADFAKTAFTIVNFDQLQEISAKLKIKKRFHLKLDTGMHRQGILQDQYIDALKLINSNRNIILEGLCSHLADPDNRAETQKQIENWNRAAKYFKKAFGNIKYTHLSATGGVRYSKKIDANLVRLGIGFYGIDSNLSCLKPALEMRSIITGIKEIGAGEKIGYGFTPLENVIGEAGGDVRPQINRLSNATDRSLTGFTFTAKEKIKIATIPAGFYEGVDRRLSNIGNLKIAEQYAAILGRVSMNITTVDITNIASAGYGSEVTIISKNSEDKNSVQNIAQICQTLAYDILVHIPEHLRRTVVL